MLHNASSSYIALLSTWYMQEEVNNSHKSLGLREGKKERRKICRSLKGVSMYYAAHITMVEIKRKDILGGAHNMRKTMKRS